MGSGYRVFTAGEVLTASNVQNYLQDQAVMVFGGTAARSSAIGTANFEEGMLTYLTDVDKLQVYTGAAFADVYPPAASAQGLTLISTTSFSGVSTQALTNVFSTTYQNYKIVINIGTQTNSRLTFRLGNLGVAVSSANYSTQNLFTRSTTVTGVLSSGATVWQIPGEDITQGWHDLTVFQPFESVLTRFAGISAAAGGAGGITNNSAGFFDLTTSFTDIFLYPSTGTMTGSVSVFGLAK